jgi:catechol 2,3-dioxygenase
VRDPEAVARLYEGAVGLRRLNDGDGLVSLSADGERPLVVLLPSPGAPAAPRRAAGLFHTAIRFSTRAQLADALRRVAQAGFRLTGASDHGVSEALYLDDPEGNGVELYWDRDRSLWSWTHGQVEMGTLYLDPNGFLDEHLTERGAALAEAAEVTPFGDAAVGHVHLSVGDVESARTFYVDRLGFETTAALGGSALFVSAGGYHHHMAMNTWNSRGAGRRQLALGLGQVEIRVPSADDLGELSERMRHYGVAARDDGRSVTFDDPWANAVRVAAATATAP